MEPKTSKSPESVDREIKPRSVRHVSYFVLRIFDPKHFIDYLKKRPKAR